VPLLGAWIAARQQVLDAEDRIISEHPLFVWDDAAATRLTEEAVDLSGTFVPLHAAEDQALADLLAAWEERDHA
jgi:hypothetical protein